MVLGDALVQQLAPWAHNPVEGGAFRLLWQVSFSSRTPPLDGVAGSPRGGVRPGLLGEAVEES